MTRAWSFGGPSAAGRVAPRPGGRAAVGIIAATLALIATLALATGLAAARLAGEWSGPGAQVATLHIIAAEDVVEAQARAALEVLRTTPGVRSVRLIEVAEQRALLAPWFGPDLALDDLPLPLMIEVAADPAALDRAALDARLAAEAPGAVYDDHAAWRAPLAESAHGVAAVAFACVGALGLALAAALALAASAAVAANGATVETLRLVGARDGFIAAALTRGLTRAAAGGVAAGAAFGLALVAAAPSAGEAGGVILVGVDPTGWARLAPVAVAAGAAAIAWAAARLAARAALRRWS